MNNNNKNKKESIQQILKNIQSQSSQEKKRKAIQILTKKQKPVNYFQNNKVDYVKTISNLFKQASNSMLRKINNPDNQKTIIITTFFIFSTYLCWKIQSKYDGMRKKSTNTKTFKQVQIQQQNQKIIRYLNRKQFQSIPINDYDQPKNSYKYQQQQGILDTKDYLLQQIARQYRSGSPIDRDMQIQLRKNGLI